MLPTVTVSRISISVRGTAIPGADTRRTGRREFRVLTKKSSRRAVFSASVAGRLISNIAPTLVRKGVAGITFAR